MHQNIRIRLAIAAEAPVLQKLIEASVRKLQAEDYTPEQIEGALTTVFGVDSQLIADGTYLVAEAKPETGSSPARPVIVGCGGWNKRKNLDGAARVTGP